jgi:hypothetical protein
MATCSLVWDNSCTAPANSLGTTRGVCFACGEPVCPSCSTLTAWYRYGRRRIGFDCLRDCDFADELRRSLAARAR